LGYRAPVVLKKECAARWRGSISPDSTLLAKMDKIEHLKAVFLTEKVKLWTSKCSQVAVERIPVSGRTIRLTLQGIHS
jgi:hypothetical protein